LAGVKSELLTRTLSAIVMVAVAGGALWAGGLVWAGFVFLVSAGVLWEWVRLALAITPKGWARVGWFVAGLGYVGVAGNTLIKLNDWHDAIWQVLLAILAAVIATDMGAYVSGRLIGGPKIAPRISPSKTWSGLVGGMLAAGLLPAIFFFFWVSPAYSDSNAYANRWYIALIIMAAGALIAIIAQAGDFFESWMKRKAGVKDSGHLIPGHGGLFDRVDGLLAVAFVLGVVGLLGRL